MIDIGSGRQVFATCEGDGSPVIILESGDESNIGQWRLVMPELSRQARTCAYDRLGTGRSDPATGCRRLKDIRSDFEAVLRALRLRGPYVLVGTSGGGFLVAGFAVTHPQDVAGLVFVETPHAIRPASAPPELLQELSCNDPRNEERRDYVAVENEAWRNRRRLGDIPMTVISNDYRDAAGLNAEQRTNVQDQRGWLVLSTQARQVVVTSGHDVPENEPDVVIREILRVLEAAR